MATDPTALFQTMLGTIGQQGDILTSAQNNFLGQEQARQAIQFNRLKLVSEQRAQAQEKQYQTDVQGYLADPTPGSLLALMSKYPQQAEALKKAWDVKDSAARTADMGQLGAIYSALENGRADLALTNLRARRDAEKAKGIDTAELDAMIEALAKNDPAAIKTVKGFALAHLAAADPDKFATNFKAVGGEPGPYTLVPGARRYDSNNQMVAEAPFAPRPVTVGQGDTVVEYQPGKGGDQPARTNGWSPRQRDGGDNTDEAVDNKLAALSKDIGVGVDEPLTPEQLRLLGTALPLTEGGAGSLADRNNNPGNIKDGSFAKSQPGYAGAGEGGFAKFKDKASGAAATQALLRRYYARGQRTIRDIIEGKPTGQSGGGSSTRVIAQGQAKPGYRVLQPNEVPPGLDPNIVYQQGPDGQITPVGGQKQDQLKVVPATIVNRVLENRRAIRNIDGALSELANYPNGVGLWIGNTPNWISQRTDPKGVAVRSAIANIGSLLIHDRSGAAVTVAETPRLLPFVPLVSDTAKAAKEKLDRLRAEIAAINEDYELQYSEEQGYRPMAAEAPVRVRSIQEARKLKPGTMYVAPDGKVRRR